MPADCISNHSFDILVLYTINVHNFHDHHCYLVDQKTSQRSLYVRQFYTNRNHLPNLYQNQTTTTNDLKDTYQSYN
ncbi:hypothetical protein CVS40_11673 [Lucilia cuprina]|nr:hypothetical protein CVS40_11673 [Lucilia cuprina]